MSAEVIVLVVSCEGLYTTTEACQLKHIITNFAIVNTHYTPKLCAKTQIMRPNYALKLCVMC